jgi:Ca2+-binding EF-hand superfamily protein
MPRTLSTVALLLTGVAIAAEPASPKPVPRDEQDLIFFQKDRPLRLRLHLQVGGRSFQAHWDETIAQLFRFLDADGDGRLSPKELEHAPSESQLRQMIMGNPDLEADEAPKFSDLTDDPRGATLEHLKGYYHRIGVAPWQVDFVERPSPSDHLDDALCKHLNPAKPDVLTRDCLKNANRLTAKLDADNDEMISAAELSLNGYQGGFKNPAPIKPRSGPFLLLDPSNKGRSILAAALIKEYDRNKDGKLSPNEIAFESELFRKLDRNGDGLLDANELARWPEAPADLEVLLRLDGPPGDSLHLLPGPSGEPQRLVPTVKMMRIGGARLQLAEETIEVLRAEGLEARQRRLETQGLYAFNMLDKNGDSVLDSKEIYQPPFSMVAMLRLADRNGDGRLTKAEYQAFLELQKKMVTRFVIITLIDRGRSLFDLLDADHDHRLSRRELNNALERLAPWIDSKTGVLDREKIPRQYQIVVSQGTLARIDTDVGAVSAVRPESRLRGPLWFRKMDRNADGDVSEREFLGTAEQFRKLDRDGDGLISPEEAEAADKVLPVRKK